MQEHPNIQSLNRFYEAYGKEDIAAVREIFAEDIIWRIPGHHPLAGAKHGANEVLAFFAQLAKAEFKAEVMAISAVGDYVLELHRGWSDYGPKLDLMWTLAFRFENGRIKEVYNMC
jgi:ketosteroid isomerase-like protein